MESSAGALLSDLVDLDEIIKADEEQDFVSLIERDQAFSQTRANKDNATASRQTKTKKSSERNRVRDVRAWLRWRRDDREMQSHNQRQPSAGQEISHSRNLTSLLVSIIGLAAGWTAAAALFRYDGSQPINVTWIILVFVLVQSLLSLLYFFVLLPRGVTRFLPPIRGLANVLESISPGRLGLLVAKILPQRYRRQLEQLMGRGHNMQRRYGTVVRWIALAWSQYFALFFQIGAIGCALVLIIFTDLAFGWSTTLDVGGGQFYRFVRAIAFPWTQGLNAAVPTIDLVENTRLFRLDANIVPNSSLSESSAQTLTGWWPFIVMSMAVYGLLPRILTFYFTRRRLKAVLQSSIAVQPGVSEVLDRLNARRVTTQSRTPEVRMAVQTHHPLEASENALIAGNAIVVNWSEVGLRDAKIRQVVQRALGTSVVAIHCAGGSNTIDEDDNVIRQLADVDEPVSVVVLVKSWETPMLEFLDFINDVRGAIGEHARIVILPTATQDGELAKADTTHSAIWKERLQTIGDPHLYFRDVIFENHE